MALDTYSGLVQEIADHLDRDDLTGTIDSLIDLAEGRHKREIRIREMLTRKQATMDARYELVPDGFLQMKSLRLLTDPVTVLTEINLHEMNRRRLETSGKPKFFTVHATIEFDRVPDTVLTAEMLFYKTLTPLSEANPTNALLERAPDAYLYAALAASAPFLANDERLDMWAALYTSARDELNALDRQRAGPLISRVVGATP